MKFTTRGRYVLRLLLDLAAHQNQGPVTVKEIAARQQLPLPYLKHLTAPLVNRGILQSARGFKGGLLLAKAPEEIKLSEIIQALEIPVASVECGDDLEACDFSSYRVTGDIWNELQKKIDGMLEAITLKDLMERQEEQEQPVAAMSGAKI